MGKITIVYVTKGGDATIERTKEPSENILEMPDGDHPLTNDSFWQDENRRMNPVLFIVQGVRAPYGGTMEQDDIKRVLYDMDLRERAFKRQSVSKMSWRFLGRMGEWVIKYGVLIVMGVIIAWALYDSLAPKGAY